ncbi:aminotransferase class V-fold PLP-dependent enzyme, partial [candidate division WOR-3 bacterium]|nr:aminotransferase class V-fold PLP-dependent enzyme [candidate division WOR-3 bacterium]
GQVPYPDAEAGAEEARGLLGRLLHVPAETVAFTKNTSAGVIVAIGSVEWRPGDNVVLMRDDFPTVTYPFNLLLPQVERRWFDSAELARDPEAVFRLVDGRTRMVAVSWVHFLTGARFDVAAVCRFCRERGVLSVIDAIQGLGAVDLDWSRVGADFVVSHGAKWLLAPQGSGFMHVNPQTLPGLRPYNLGWLSAEWREFNDIFGPKPVRPDARRFEEGTKNYLGIWGMRGSLRLMLSVGMEAIGRRVRALVDALRGQLGRAGFDIVTPAGPDRSAGILTCRKPGADMAALHQRLTDAGVAVSLRENMLRISPHFYNDEDEIERLVRVLAG